MKKILVIGIIITNYLFCSTIALGKIEANAYNNFSKSFNERRIHVLVNPDNGEISLGIVGSYLAEFIFLAMPPKDQPQFVSVLKKYLEWHKKAIEKKITLDKSISNVSIITAWKMGGDTYIAYPAPELNFTFFSQNKKRHQLVVIFPKLKSKKNEFMTLNPDNLYIEKNYVEMLLKYLSKEHIDKTIEKEKKQKEIESDFN